MDVHSLHQAPTNLAGFSWISSRSRGNSSCSKSTPPRVADDEESPHGQVQKSTIPRRLSHDLCRVGIVRPRLWRRASELAYDLRPTWGGQEPLGAPSAGKPGLLDRRPSHSLWYLPASLRASESTHRVGRRRRSLCRPSGDSPAQGLEPDGT